MILPPNRLNEIEDARTAEGSEDFHPDGHDIVFENVGFGYDDKQVLDGVSFTAKEGEVTALVGPSGSGKSTCTRLAARLWDNDSGAIKVGGVDIKTIDPETLLTDYSMVFQDVVLFDDTVMENIRLGKHGATDEEVRAAARAANCDEFVEKFPNRARRMSCSRVRTACSAAWLSCRAPVRAGQLRKRGMRRINPVPPEHRNEEHKDPAGHAGPGGIFGGIDIDVKA